ncbi:MAG: hypothetical protein ACYCR5_09805 [Leptospirillum sp.]
MFEDTVSRSRISCQFQNDWWQREIQAGHRPHLSGGGDLGVGPAPSEIPEENAKGKNVSDGGRDPEEAIQFPVSVGELLSLGTVSIPRQLLVSLGSVPSTQFLCRTSTSLISSVRGLVSDPYRYSRYWTGKEYSLEGLEEISRLIDRTHGHKLLVLPLWVVRSSGTGNTNLLDFIRGKTDLLFRFIERPG